MIVDIIASASIIAIPVFAVWQFKRRVFLQKQYELELDKFFQSSRRILKRDMPIEAIELIQDMNDCVEHKVTAPRILSSFLRVNRETRANKTKKISKSETKWVDEIRSDASLAVELDEVLGHAFLAMLYTGHGINAALARKILIKPFRRHLLNEFVLAHDFKKNRSTDDLMNSGELNPVC